MASTPGLTSPARRPSSPRAANQGINGSEGVYGTAGTETAQDDGRAAPLVAGRRQMADQPGRPTERPESGHVIQSSVGIDGFEGVATAQDVDREVGFRGMDHIKELESNGHQALLGASRRFHWHDRREQGPGRQSTLPCAAATASTIGPASPA